MFTHATASVSRSAMTAPYRDSGDITAINDISGIAGVPHASYVPQDMSHRDIS
jgi:hypothetical protein